MDFVNFEALDANTLLAAFQNGYTTVEVQFLNDRLQDGNELPSGKLYTYKVPTMWNVVKGDWLVVLPSSAYKNVIVQAVHDTPRDYGKDIKWAVQKIDGGFYFQMKTQEDTLKSAVQALKKKREAELLLAELQRTVGGEGIQSLMAGFQSLLGVQVGQQAPQIAEQTTQQPAAQQAAQPPGVAVASVDTDAMQAAAAARATQAGQPLQQVQAGNVQGAAAPISQGTSTAAGGNLPSGGVAKPSWAQ